MRADNRHTPVKEIVEGKSFDRPLGGFAGVANVGLDANWLRASDGDGEPLRLRPTCVESRHDAAE